MQVLLLGHPADAHAAHIYRALTQKGIETFYWDTSKFPAQLQMSWRPETQTGQLRLQHGKVDLNQVHSVFWRTLSTPQVPPIQNEQIKQVAISDTSSAIRTLIQGCSARWINSWQAYQFHREKPLQLAKVGSMSPLRPNHAVKVGAAMSQNLWSVIFLPLSTRDFDPATNLLDARLDCA